MLPRIGLFAFLTAAGLAIAAPGSSGAATQLGETFAPVDSFGGPGTFVQSTSPDNSYAAPTDGVITSWSFEAAADPPTEPLKLKIVRAAGGDDFTTVGDSQLETPTPGTLNTWPTRISVKAGDVLGHFYTSTDETFSFRFGPLGFDTHELCCSDPVLDPPTGTTATYDPNTDLQIDVSALLEPDADHDGFGDETQDQCPGTAGPQNGCPIPTGLRAAALKKCKKKAKKNHWSKKRLKKCKKKARLLPV